MSSELDNVVALAERLTDQDAKRIAELATSVERNATVKYLRESCGTATWRLVAQRLADAIEKGQHVP